MIFDLVQTKSGMSMEWVVIGEKDLMAEILAPCEKGGFIAYISAPTYRQELIFDPENTVGSIAERYMWSLYENGECIGNISQKSRKVKGIFQSYVYDEFTYRGQIYHIYEVGLGAKGLYLCIYRNETLIAMVDKKLKVTNYLDSYKCYLLEENDAPMVISYVIRYDASKYANMFERSVHATQRHKLNTIQKEVLNKYDPYFIEKVKGIK